MLLNPRNPHHGVDCICDNCWKYWGEYARALGKAVASERATEQAVNNGGTCSDTGDDLGTNQGEESPPSNPTQEGDSGCERDCNPDPQAGNPLTYLSGG